ncbi:drug resistance MFS transporter, drug:H+ antiporter-2 family [Brevibacterium mcbrellneri ATCC 49030]|uniref:Drug resistance MFS transporter, drug:H+ antiporter-2 family n=1 Tax=Brevibacterium mcbrellneri ATCC 49030 TaxID=585530 RepID=D4YQJ5_9MICO|nr:MDR family MFS transporter [Brevibacterium mcbrellneri]EFG46483.1 drug resistance MFS transporter, drug:H+ antiporter-2 family [Brevibacterium mcbrellneri ATCC 49030]
MIEPSHASGTGESTQSATRRTRLELPDENTAPEATDPNSTETPREFTGLDRQGKLVIAGLMLGMFVAAISQTIVGPALPRIVAELGGMEHYSWIATAAMLMSAVTVPVVGKLSDMYGRKPFYIGGLVVFMLGAALAGMATNFWFLVFARALQGAGMGTLMPLSQTIIGDIIPPRQRGKYQGLMGATFGIASVAGPLLGGWVTDTLGWRYLFYLALPIGVVALVFLAKFMHVPQQRSHGKLDYLGIITLTPGLVIGLLAISWGGNTYEWTSPVILGMGAISVVLLAAFVWVETRVENPLIPLRMLRNSTVSLSILASFFIAVAMFGAIIYIPVYAQGVLSVSATQSGAILIPLNVAMIVTSILMGVVITKTGNYKVILILGAMMLLGGYVLLSMLSWQSNLWDLTLAMTAVGMGLGMSMQTYTLVVQNAVDRTELGVATAAVQFFRNVGSTIGIAVLGSIMSSAMMPKIQEHLPAGAKDMGSAMGADSGVGSALDPAKLESLPGPIVDAIHQGMGEAMHLVFVSGVPFVVAALVLALFVKQLTLRTTH